MPKPGYNELDKECPICGSIIWGKGQRVLIEGAKITVCYNCAQHGTKMPEPSTGKISRKIHPPYKSNSPQRRTYTKNVIDNIEIVPDFAKKIRTARDSLGINQEQFAQKLNEKPSLLRRIESGKVKPSLKLAKKIEKVYNIKLLQKGDSIDANIQGSKYMKKTSGTSLGDTAFIKKKK